MNDAELIAELDRLSFICSIEINPHRSFYDSVADHFTKHTDYPSRDDIVGGEETYKEMVKRDRIVEIRCYPITPVSFYEFSHYDFATVAKYMIEVLQEEREDYQAYQKRKGESL